ncbi:Proteinaceous RNase P 2 [Hibiscus syriacus]|uniref:ribonuclease P n=1 Tax=Hibiscus syriacus TaxID=106335 RepID=A0A6A2Z5F3_HIBSY|nr:proteinaceous RNase P 2-like [Hibiscus syriacus]KAE8687231.1 Proteinaceous RNase P 2 [Hibiscus syriacus]
MATPSHHQNPTNPTRKKKTLKNPVANFLYELHSCSKSKDLKAAISLYESAISNETRLNQDHFNTLLYLCSTFATDPYSKDLALQYGFRVSDHMMSLNIRPNEASVTAIARLAEAKGDGDYAFEIVKTLGDYQVPPRLRTYEPALFCFCQKLEADKAYEVEEDINIMGLSLEEPQIAALLKLSADTGREERVYNYLHKLRRSVRWISDETGKILEDWFLCKTCEIGSEGAKYDVDSVKEAILMNGGGWHGLGWIGEGKWVVRKGNVESNGRCCSCGEQLDCVDIGDVETEKFALSVAGLAMEREVKANFREFQDWLEKNANYEAIVDGANIGLYQQNFADGGFSVIQLDAVVKEMYTRTGNKWPLVILHNKRVRALLENPSSRKMVEEWMANGILYTTPHGANDDWYWLYAAVKLRCLLVTNDEMRDHIFELLGNSFFLKWKERHQVRYTFLKGTLKLQMPLTYSIFIQESEKGSWHVPIVGNSDEETSRTWLCITRPGACEDGSKTCEIDNGPCCKSPISEEGENRSHEKSDDKSTSMTGKRKDRSP